MWIMFKIPPLVGSDMLMNLYSNKKVTMLLSANIYRLYSNNLTLFSMHFTPYYRKLGGGGASDNSADGQITAWVQ